MLVLKLEMFVLSSELWLGVPVVLGCGERLRAVFWDRLVLGVSLTPAATDILDSEVPQGTACPGVPGVSATGDQCKQGLGFR